MADAYGWSQPEIEASDPDFIAEVLALLHARADERHIRRT